MIHPIFLDGIKPKDRVAVAMSGGVDSSVAAALMVKAGYDVVGITLQLYDQGEMVQKKGACCAGQDIYDAHQVAHKIGIPHYVLDYENVFKQKVIDDFVDSYLQGQTPIPCIRCNQQVKFKDLLQTAKELDAKALVTGHYIRRIVHQGKAQLHRASDKVRDQSYFLFTTTQEQLDFLHFPLGGLESKTVTRDYAKYFDLPVSSKPDSQDICFVINGNYGQVIEKYRPGALDPGNIMTMDGQVIGRHNGIINFTVGQRKGIGIGGTESPLYVIKIDPDTHSIIVGPKEALAVKKLYLIDVNWLEDLSLMTGLDDVSVKIRSTSPPLKAIVEKDNSTQATTVTLEKSEFGVSKGQACVFYNGDRVLGGGWIRDTANEETPHI